MSLTSSLLDDHGVVAKAFIVYVAWLKAKQESQALVKHLLPVVFPMANFSERTVTAFINPQTGCRLRITSKILRQFGPTLGCKACDNWSRLASLAGGEHVLAEGEHCVHSPACKEPVSYTHLTLPTTPYV